MHYSNTINIDVVSTTLVVKAYMCTIAYTHNKTGIDLNSILKRILFWL